MPYVAENLDPYSDDPQWTGVGNYSAWIAEYKPYALAWVQSALLTTPSFLNQQPNSAEWHPGEVVATGGDGRPIMAGWPKVVWNFDRLNASQMYQLLYARNNGVGGPYQPRLYFVTRDDYVVDTLDLSTGFAERQFSYVAAKGFMLPVEYETQGRYVFRNVKVAFQHVERL